MHERGRRRVSEPSSYYNMNYRMTENHGKFKSSKTKSRSQSAIAASIVHGLSFTASSLAAAGPVGTSRSRQDRPAGSLGSEPAGPAGSHR
jgi:hypothetical protein